MAALNDTLHRRLLAAGIDPAGLRGGALDPWEAWLRLRARWGRRATLVDLYELEAAFRGIGLEELKAADRERLKVVSRHARREQAEVVPGSGRSGDPHEVNGYDPAWPGCFGVWHRRLVTMLGDAAARIDHVGSTSVPGLAAKPVIDIQVSVVDVGDERSYLRRAESAGLVLRLRERGHRLLWPPAGKPREVHVHICGCGSTWERDHLLFRDYLRAHPGACHSYAALKRELQRLCEQRRTTGAGHVRVASPGPGACGSSHRARPGWRTWRALDPRNAGCAYWFPGMGASSGGRHCGSLRITEREPQKTRTNPHLGVWL